MPVGRYDVIIAGAGPAGIGCALALRNSGLRLLLIDKSTFPRDKVCGDAIPHRAVSVLHDIAPEAWQSLRLFEKKVHTRGCRVVAPNKKYVDVFFKLEGYTSARIDFDQFLFETVARQPNLRLLTGEAVRDVRISEAAVTVTAGDQTFEAAAIAGCDGAHSVVERHTTNRKQDPRHHAGAVRAYYRHVKDATPGLMEIHLFREFPAAYFWIFPLTDGLCNVGLGMLTKKISDGRLSLFRLLGEITHTPAFLGHRFGDALLIGKPKGFGLPMGSRRVRLSGNRYVLCGDAAALIDPATGEGIGNAMLSGVLAAEQLKRCFSAKDLSGKALEPYDRALYGLLGREFRNKHLLQRLLGNRSWLANAAVGAASRSAAVRNILQKMF